MKFLIALAALLVAAPLEATPFVRPVVRPRAVKVYRPSVPARPRSVSSDRAPYWWHAVLPYVGHHTADKERRLLDKCRNTPEDEMSDACLEILNYE